MKSGENLSAFSKARWQKLPPRSICLFTGTVCHICDTVLNNALGIERKQAQYFFFLSSFFFFSFEASIMSHCLYANAAVTASEPLIRASFCCRASAPHSEGWGAESRGDCDGIGSRKPVNGARKVNLQLTRLLLGPRQPHSPRVNGCGCEGLPCRRFETSCLRTR